MISCNKRLEKEQKSLLSSSFLLFLFIACIASCSLKTEHQQVSDQVWVPWPDSNGEYQVQKVMVDTVTQWSPLRGSAANIRSHFIPISNDRATATEVEVSYSLDSSGAVIPMTPFSIEIASLYVNFERLQKLDQKLGIVEANKTRNVYVKLKSQKEDGSLESNNAFYNLLTDSFYVLPYVDSLLPLTVNGAVLAHEHFHSIFGRLLQRPLYDYGLSKNIDLFEDYSHHHSATYEEEFQELFTHSQGSRGAINSTALFDDHQRGDRLQVKTTSSFHEKLINNPDAFLHFHLNKIFLMALNEGLADVWAWFYSHNPCFISNSFNMSRLAKMPSDLWGRLDGWGFEAEGRISSRSSFPETRLLADHDNRCLSFPKNKIFQQATRTLINRNKLISVHEKMKNNSKGLFEIEKKIRNVMGYRLGTNLARLFYQRLAEQGALYDREVQELWAKHIITTLSQLLPKMKEVYIDHSQINEIFPWEETMDLLLFGEGSSDLSKENCSSWANILGENASLKNFKKKCAMELGI